MRSKLGVSALLVLVTACGGSGSPEGPAEDPVGAPSRDDDPVTGSPDANELTDERGVFVVASAAPGGDGTRVRPLSTIMSAIAMAKASGKRVFVCGGTYKEQLVLEDGVSISGNLDCARPERWQIGGARARLEAPTTLAIRANGITKSTRIEGFDIFAADATEPSRSSMGLWAVGSPGLVIANSTIHAGKGARGTDGKDGIQLEQQGTLNGEDGYVPAPFKCFPPEFLIPCPTVSGGKFAGYSMCKGVDGYGGEFGGGGGHGGVYASIYVVGQWRPYNQDPKYAAAPGRKLSGANGQDGRNGVSPARWGTVTREGFVAANGTRGENGTRGVGGSGGDGIAPSIPINAVTQVDLWWGHQGPGGGAGGCPGLAGTEGTGGGASIAALLVDSPMIFSDVELASADGGAGGKGNFGSHFFPGGLAGHNTSSNPAGNAYNGGRGGLAGVSGSGAGGPSLAIAHTGGEPTLVGTKLLPGKGGDGVPLLTEAWGGITKTIPASLTGGSIPLHAF